MKRQLVICLLLLSGCATVRDELLPTVGNVLNQAHQAQAAAVDARDYAKAAVDFVCRQPLPETEAVCSEAHRALGVSLDALIISADGLDAASEIYTEANEASK
jgi:uncharacterized protein YceK